MYAVSRCGDLEMEESWLAEMMRKKVFGCGRKVKNLRPGKLFSSSTRKIDVKKKLTITSKHKNKKMKKKKIQRKLRTSQIYLL